MKAKVIDNFLPQDYFDQIVDVFENQSIAWFWSDCVAYDADDSEFYFTHTFYKDHTPNSDYFSMFDPLLKKLNCEWAWQTNRKRHDHQCQCRDSEREPFVER